MAIHLWQGRWNGRMPNGDQHTRARKVISPSGGIVRGKFPSRKNGRMIHHEGLLELDAIYVFETSFAVVSYKEQPRTIRYPDGSRLRRYTPDFEIHLRTGETVTIEIKPLRSFEYEKTRHAFACIEPHFQRSGEPFEILLDTVLRQEPRQSNLRWIYHHAPRVSPTETRMAMAMQRYFAHFPTSIRNASVLLLNYEVDPYSVLLSGMLFCSLAEPISLDTILHIPEESENGWFRISEKYSF